MSTIRYILINIRKFFQYHKMLFILMIVSGIISTICLLFSFGLFQKTRQRSGVLTSEETFFCFDFYREEGVVEIQKDMKSKVEQFRQFLGNDLDTQNNSMNILYRTFSDNEDKSFAASSYYYSYSNRFSPQEIKENKYMCDIHECYLEYVKDGMIELSGNKYKVTNIRYGEEAFRFIIFPIESIPENSMLTSVSFDLKEQPTKEKIEEIQNKFTELFGVSVPILPEAKDLMDVQINNMFYLYAVLIAIIIVLNLSLYFNYIFNINKREMRIMKLCGATSKNVSLIFISETMIELIAGYIIGNILFSLGALKIIRRSFINFDKYYSSQVYIITFLIFIFVSLIIVSIITVPYVNKVLSTDNRRESE